MFRLVIFALLPIVLSVGADAQTASQTDYDAAILAFESGDTREAVRLAERSVAEADTPADRFDALVLFGDIRTELGDDSTAYQLYARAVEVVEEFDPENSRALSYALRLQASRAMALGWRQDWADLTQRSVDLNQAEYGLLWRYEDRALLRHRFTAYPCPVAGHGLARSELRVFRNTGLDISCVYVFQDRLGPIVSIHMTYSPNSNQASAFQNADIPVRQNFAHGRELERDSEMIGGVPVEYALYRENDATTGVWTSQLGDWVLKLRLTHRGEIERADMQAAAELTFEGSQAVMAHLQSCELLSGTMEAPSQASAADSFTLALLVPQLLAPESPDERGDYLSCFIDTAAFHPNGGTSFAEFDDSGQLVGYRARSVDGVGSAITATPQIGIAELHQRLSDDASGPGPTAETTFALRRNDGQTIDLFGNYPSAPAPSAFARDVADILEGHRLPTAAVGQNEEGGTTIYLQADPDETAPEE